MSPSTTSTLTLLTPNVWTARTAEHKHNEYQSELDRFVFSFALPPPPPTRHPLQTTYEICIDINKKTKSLSITTTPTTTTTQTTPISPLQKPHKP